MTNHVRSAINLHANASAHSPYPRMPSIFRTLQGQSWFYAVDKRLQEHDEDRAARHSLLDGAWIIWINPAVRCRTKKPWTPLT